MSTKEIQRAFESWHLVQPALFVPHTEAEYEELVKLLDRLIDEVGESENHPLASLMEVIGVLIEKYEDAHVPVLRGK